MATQQSGGKPKAGGITHARAKALFSMAWDGEIGGPELRALREHLGGCVKCARATDLMRSFLARLDDLACRD